MNADKILELFAGRTDAFTVTGNGHYECVRPQNGEFRRLITAHINGTHRVGVFPITDANVVRFAVIDFDSHGKNEQYKDLIYYVTFQVQAHLAHEGILSFVELSKSGYGNFHVWLFFEEPIAARSVRRVLIGFVEYILNSIKFGKQDSRPSYEIFPKQDRLDNGGLGNCVNLPLFPPDVENGRTIFVDEG